MKRAFTPRVAKRSLVAAIAVAGVLGAGILGIGAVRSAEPASGMHGTDRSDGHDGWGHGRWGHGGGYGGGHGSEKARCEMFLDHIKDVDKKLTADQVRDIVAGKLASQGEGTLKVGKVAAKAPGVVGVEIVTTSGSLVTTRDISTKTGLPVGIEKRCEDRMAGRDDHERGGHGGMHGGFMRGLAALGPDGGERDLKLTPDQVKKLAEAYVIMTGNPRLKVGAVKEKDAKTVGVDIVTVDNALVVHRDVDRQTGRVVRPD